MPKDDRIEIQHAPERHQFEARLGEDLAVLSYSRQDAEVTLDRTYVPNAFRGRGVAARLVRAALNEARRQHWKVIPNALTW